MIQPVKRLRLEHAYNVRDLGGYEAFDGQVTSFRRLLRSDGLQRLTKEEWERLYSYGVRTVLDLRSLAEIKLHPDQVPENMMWYHCPLQRAQIDLKDVGGSAAQAFAGSLTEGYVNMVKHHGDLLAAALKQLTKGLQQGAVLFHCSAGKDRTGVLASAVLYMMGVEREDIIADYEVTFTYNRRGINRMLERMDPETAKSMHSFMTSDAVNMERLTAYYEETGLSDYLEQYGFTRQERETLQREFLSKNYHSPVES